MFKEKRWISPEALFTAIEALLAEDRQAVFVVTGMSMWPFLCHGRDQVVVEKYERDRLKKGDTVLFQTPTGKYLLHRITKLTPDFFETTGDGNCFRDGHFPYSCIRARVCKFIRKGKTISCDSPFWRTVFGLWAILFPVRRYILKTLVRISHVKDSVKSKLKRR